MPALLTIAPRVTGISYRRLTIADRVRDVRRGSVGRAAAPEPGLERANTLPGLAPSREAGRGPMRCDDGLAAAHRRHQLLLARLHLVAQRVDLLAERLLRIGEHLLLLL